MRSTLSSLLALTALGCGAPALAQGKPLGPIEIGEGVTLDPIVDIRLRLETAEQDTFADTAESVTVRTRAGANLKFAKNFSILAEAEGTFHLKGDFNDTLPGNGIEPFPVIADPDSLELNRIQAAYNGKDVSATIGRQRIILDDARFVGNVGWRQNEQTFDAGRVKAKLGPVTVDQTYAIGQRTIFGSESPNNVFDGEFVFTNVKAPLGDKITLTGFRYEVNYEDRLAFASTTYGATAIAKFPVGGVTLGLKGTFASQSDAGQNPNDFTTEYYLGEASVSFSGFTLRAQHEVLGSDGGRSAFQTPLATAHKFNGYADLFLVTPATGLADTNVRLSKKFKVPGLKSGINVQLTYHEFESDFGDIEYGTEFDAVVSFKIKDVSILAKLGDYYTDGFGPDTTRFTLQAGISF